MPQYSKIGRDVFQFNSFGLEYYPSSSLFTPTSSNPSTSQISVITCSISGSQIDYVNNSVHEEWRSYGTTTSGNIYFQLCLFSHERGLLGDPLTRESHFSRFRYATGSIFDISSSNTNYYETASGLGVAEDISYRTIYYNPSDTALQIAQKTYHQITSSLYYGRRFSATLSSSNTDNYIFITHNTTGVIDKPNTTYTGSFQPNVIKNKFSSSIVTPGVGNVGYIPPQMVTDASASFKIKVDPNDNKSIAFTVGSSSFGGSVDRTTYYVSSSGRIGFNTTDPQSEIDFIADDFQVQKPGKRQGIKVNKEGNIESFNNETTAASTGSELIMSYGRGGSTAITKEIMEVFYGGEYLNDSEAQNKFNDLDSASQTKILYYAELEGYMVNQVNIGDTLGAIRWVAASGSSDTQDDFNSRTTGEAAKIEAVVNASSKLGVSADLLFKIADSTAVAADEDVIVSGDAIPKTMLRLDGYYRHELTGSLDTTSYINPGYIHQIGTSDNSFGGHIILSNNKIFKGKETGGTSRNMLFMGTNNVVQVGATNTPLSLRSSGIISATGSLDISGAITASSISTTTTTETWYAGWTMDSITSYINWAGTSEQTNNSNKHYTQRVVPHNATMKKFILRLRQKSGDSGIGHNSILTMYSRSFSNGTSTNTTSSVASTNGEFDLAYSSASFNLNDAPGNNDGLAVLEASNFSNAVTIDQYDGVSFSVKRGDNNADAIQANVTIVWEYNLLNNYTPTGSHS